MPRLPVLRAFDGALSLWCAVIALWATACLKPPPPEAVDATKVSVEGETFTPDASHDVANPAPRLLGDLRLGWNVGNSLDVPDGETKWGNPTITPELMVAVKQAGFDLVRIPITWTKRTGPGPDFTIDPAFLGRVDEVVGYARAAGLTAVINLHHDGADGFEEVEWLTLNDKNGQTTPENDAQVKARFVAVWAQIARHFANHDEGLIFESMNEIHDGYGQPDPRHFTFINQLNQAFVTFVRDSGGNNASRYLVVPGYNTNIEHTLTGFELPKDTADKRLILSVHYYDPYLFALVAKTHTWGKASPGHDDWGQEDFVVEQFDKLRKKYIEQGVPVLMGEYGATHQDGYEDYRRYYMEYVTKAAVDRGIVPVYWDNGGRGSGGENFALMDRQNNGVFRPKILEAMMRAAKSPYKLSEVAPPQPSK